MRIAIHTASAAVRATLESLLLRNGNSLTSDLKTADLVIDDRIHPAMPEPATSPTCLKLVKPPATDTLSLTAPFRPEALATRLKQLGRKEQLTLGNGWSLDWLARELTHAEAPALPLTEKECELLKALAQAQPAALGRDALLAEVWGVGSTIDTHTLETHIYRLRSKLEPLTPSPGELRTEGGNYRWENPA